MEFRDSQQLYLDLLKKMLIDFHRTGNYEFKPILLRKEKWRSRMIYRLNQWLARRQLVLARVSMSDPELRRLGKDWPAHADSMLGLERLDNVEHCVRKIIQDNVPGDLIETGVWRGGSVIFMKALLDVMGDTDRQVWVADSFEGLPRPNAGKYEADAGDQHYLQPELAISKEQVQANFEKYGLLDERVRFLKGWFKDTLPNAPIERLSLLRLDGDMYESTMDGFRNLYHKLSVGGFCIIDDYGAVKGCRQATHDFREQHGINEEIIRVDWTGAYWRKTRAV